MNGDALTTKERIKERLTITTDGFDSLLDNLILAVTARIEQMCGRRFTEGTFEDELHDGSDLYGSVRTFLIVKNAPLQSTTSIEYRAGTSSDPDWTELDEDDYYTDLEAGIIHVPAGLPRGFRNIRITYTGGYSGYSLGLVSLWQIDAVPTGTIDGTNRTFTLPEAASQIIVYADGIRESAANITFIAGDDEFTFAEGRAPVTTLVVDYLQASATTEGDGTALPADLVEVCEKAVIRTFKRRQSEGKSSEGFQESQITWEKSVFTSDDLATIRNYRRGYNI